MYNYYDRKSGPEVWSVRLKICKDYLLSKQLVNNLLIAQDSVRCCHRHRETQSNLNFGAIRADEFTSGREPHDSICIKRPDQYHWLECDDISVTHTASLRMYRPIIMYTGRAWGNIMGLWPAVDLRDFVLNLLSVLEYMANSRHSLESQSSFLSFPRF